ncbi:uncharacterized protein BJX67DRAFT_347830 [Aspergillus lucknowensis]|uniref:BTB domain-containing protein n=1 Tax=Aspergillus lucknowensis TaxID=176173 RepID=A0ABR4LXB4_9EURO
MSSLQLSDFIFFEDADTLAFIDPAPYRPAYFLKPSSAQSIGHRLHSSKLLATGSPFFQQLFDPKVQERNIKRRGQPPDGIKYIIDLTPPSTDEDAVLILTELSCPLGIRTWAAMMHRWGLPPSCVGGGDWVLEDHLGPCPEYAPSRHHAGIVHILRVLEGLDPQLNHPCKLWTFFALAKLYEIATLPQISVRVTLWVYELNNKLLIELQPEITYRLAKGIQRDYLLADSFSILVGEEALRLLQSSGNPIPKNERITVHGRPQELLDDDDVQRVQYAGESFLNYIIASFIELTGTEMHWLNESPMLRKLLSFRSQDPSELEAVSDLISTLKDFVRASIFVTLSQQRTTWLSSKFKLHNTSQDFLNVYGSLSLIERITTRTFWQQLVERSLTKNDVEEGPEILWDQSLASLAGNIGAFRDQGAATIRRVTAAELNRKADIFNQFLSPFESDLPSGATRKSFRTAHPYFSVDGFVEEAHFYIGSFARMMLCSNRAGVTYELTDTLTCLTDKEFRYLPLWAGGCDDGTGGVYADQPPLAEADGFSAPGPSIHTGSTVPSYAPSMISVLESTVQGASHIATEGHASEVISINSAVMSETDNGAVGSSDFQKIDDELSFSLDSSAEDLEDVSFDTDSDSNDTVIVGDHGEMSDFEELTLEDTNSQRLPIRGKPLIEGGISNNIPS